MKKSLIIVGLGVAFIASCAAAYQYGVFRFSNPSAEQYPVRGIDVSHHQGVIDWRQVAAQELDFVYIKASEGGDWRDPMFATNYDGARDAGLNVGAYHFFTLCMAGVTQAQNFIEIVPDSALPPVIDLEYVGNCSNRPNKEDFLIELSAFTDAIEQHYDVAPIIYSTRDFYEDYLTKNELANDRLWVRDLFGAASWPETRKALFHQHANNGRLKGISGPVDLNVFLGSRAEFEALLVE